MQSDVTRLMVELAVSRTLKEWRQGDCKRSLRKLVDYGQYFSSGRFPRDFFSTVQKMLREEDHPYYALVSRAVSSVDQSYLMHFDINLGYESMTRSARLIRQWHQQQNCWIPWLMGIPADTLPLSHAISALCEGDLLGIRSYALFTHQPDAAYISALTRQFPTFAFFLLLPDESVEEKLLDDMEGTPNICTIPMRKGGSFRSPELFRKRRRFYTPCRVMRAEDLRQLMQHKDLRCPGDEDCIFPVFLADLSVPQLELRSFRDFAISLRTSPLQSLFPIEMRGDILGVEKIITHEGHHPSYSLPPVHPMSGLLVPGEEFMRTAIDLCV